MAIIDASESWEAFAGVIKRRLDALLIIELACCSSDRAILLRIQMHYR